MIGAETQPFDDEAPDDGTRADCDARLPALVLAERDAIAAIPAMPVATPPA